MTTQPATVPVESAIPLEWVAWHEAGHAVTSFRLGRAFQTISGELPGRIVMTLGLFMSGCCVELIIVLQLGN